MLWRARLWAPISRGRRSTLEMQVLKSWQAQYFAYPGFRLRGRGSIWELSKGLGCCRARLWAPISRGTRSTLEMQVLKSWQAQSFVHLGLRLRGRGSIWELSKGLGCCRARLWAPILRGTRSTLERQVLKSWQAQYFASPGLAFARQGQRLGAV